MERKQEKRIYPDFGEPPFRSLLLFEINSLIGRKFFYNSTSRFVINKSPILVDIGVGANYTDGWIHVDFYRSRICKPWNIRKAWWPQRKPEVETDLRYPLNCDDSVVDGVYSGHTLEHLYPRHAYQLLSEIYRILKPACWLRINVPDLKRAVDIYNGKIQSDKFSYGAEAISLYTQDSGHHSAWDEELLSKALEICGFINIRKVAYGTEGTDKRLIKEQEVRKEVTLVIEAQKPDTK